MLAIDDCLGQIASGSSACVQDLSLRCRWIAHHRLQQLEAEMLYFQWLPSSQQ